MQAHYLTAFDRRTASPFRDDAPEVEHFLVIPEAKVVLRFRLGSYDGGGIQNYTKEPHILPVVLAEARDVMDKQRKCKTPYASLRRNYVLGVWPLYIDSTDLDKSTVRKFARKKRWDRVYPNIKEIKTINELVGVLNGDFQKTMYDIIQDALAPPSARPRLA